MKSVIPQTEQRNRDLTTLPRRYISVGEAPQRYSGTAAGWRRWILDGSLGDAVVRFGRLVRLDAAKLDERLQQTGQLLIRSKDR